MDEVEPPTVALAEVRQQIRALQTRGQHGDRLREEISRRERQTTALWGQAEMAYGRLAREGGNFPPWSRRLDDSVWNALSNELEQAYRAAGGDDVRQALAEAQNALGRLEGEANQRQERLEALRQSVDDAWRSLGLPELGAEPGSTAKLRQCQEHMHSMTLGDAHGLEERKIDLNNQVATTRARTRELESQLGLEHQFIDLADATAELEKFQRQLQVRDRAREMVGEARRRVVDHVMPNTIEYMRRLLPELTDQRYRDAELTDDYRIRVWDERAGMHGGWKQKNIFSGGTRDQLSLALRLAFALATLPEEHGSAPGFIFLDEPLGSFDDDRARSLLHLLTEGEIAQCFDQIFLISHVRVDSPLFNYHVVLEHGRVVDSNLPEPPDDVRRDIEIAQPVLLEDVGPQI
jgi:DNA repair exonuclease SbcCD ATPase subunit